MKLRTLLTIFIVVGLLLVIPCFAANNATSGTVSIKEANGKVAVTSSGPTGPSDPSVMSPENQPEWGAWQNLGQVQTSGTVYFANASPAVVARMPGLLDVFAFDTSGVSNNPLKTKWWNYEGWLTSWTQVSGPLSYGYNPVTATALNGYRIDVFANGDDPGSVFQTTWTHPTGGVGWLSSWSKPDGVDFRIMSNSGPSAVSPNSTTQYVFWTSPDNHVRYMSWNGVSWQYSTGTYNGNDLGTPPGLTITSSPAAVALDFEDYLVNPGDVVVFARASDNRLWYREHVFRQLNPPQWTWNQWEMVPGSFNDLAGAPAVVSRYAYCYDVVYRTDAGKIVLREYTYANGWSGETILDQFGLDSDPAIASWDQARLDVFLEHPDGTIWHTYWASPKPKIIDVFPRSIMAGSINTTITITGNNFYPNSEVKIDVPDSQPLLITKYINEHTLTAVVPTSWLTTSGSFPIYVDVPGTTQTNFHSADYTITVTMKSNLPIAKIGLTNGQTWYLDSNGNGTFDAGDKVNGFGLPGWTPVVGDWQGTGISSIGVYKDGAWYLDTNGDGAFNAGDSVCSFGLAGWTPIVGDWNGNGKTKIGVTNGQTWYLDTNGDGIFNAGDNVYSFGAPGWTPVIGKWS